MLFFVCQDRRLEVDGRPSKENLLGQFGLLKVQSCKSCNSKCMVSSTKIMNTEIFAFIAVLVFKLLSRKVLFINRKDSRNC